MELRRARNAAGLCAYCGLQPKVEARIGCVDCGRGHSKENSTFSKNRPDRTALYRKRIRKQAIQKYGGRCVCCGVVEVLFLTIDHINGDGSKDRQKHGGTGWYMELLRTERRNDLQVLCYNCNMGREVNGGICPHHSPSPDDLWESDLRRLKRFNKGCKYNWPDDVELLRQYMELGCTKTARALGVSADSVIKRLNRRGLRKRDGVDSTGVVRAAIP
jgi:hypothetical protein